VLRLPQGDPGPAGCAAFGGELLPQLHVGPPVTGGGLCAGTVRVDEPCRRA